MSEEEERRCPSCDGLVDAEGETRGECPLMSPPGQCRECGACFCDWSC